MKRTETLGRLAISIEASLAQDGEGIVTLAWAAPDGLHKLLLSIPMAERTALALERAAQACVRAGGTSRGDIEDLAP